MFDSRTDKRTAKRKGGSKGGKAVRDKGGIKREKREKGKKNKNVTLLVFNLQYYSRKSEKGRREPGESISRKTQRTDGK